jgi:FkbM family methyltransferase
MITISEHTLEETIIEKDGWVLDLGCINFSFAKAIQKYCDNVLCVDPNPNINPNEIPEGLIYERVAVTHMENVSENTFYIYNDRNGYSLLNPKMDWCQLETTITVPVCTIKSLMEKYNIEQFELIKFDIEGAEYAILDNIDWNISKQFSIEFHDFRFMNPCYPNNELYYDRILPKIKEVCEVVTHEPTDHPGFPPGYGKNYWDSLFVRKNLN